MTFLTTEAFLDQFGLKSAEDLPGLAEMREAGLLNADVADPTAELDVSDSNRDE